MTRSKPRHNKERSSGPDAVDADWRLFIAIAMPAGAQRIVSELVNRFQPHGWPVRWVAADTAHLTLHFLGDVAPARAGLLRLAIPGIVARHKRFMVRTSVLGVFPDTREPRVIWLGLTGETHRLSALHADIARMLKELDFPVEERPYQPHVTLGRVREGPPRDLAPRIMRAISNAELAESLRQRATEIEVGELVLMRSVHVRGAMRHDPVARFRLP